MSTIDNEVFELKSRVCEWVRLQERTIYVAGSSRATSRSSSRSSRSSRRSQSSGHSKKSVDNKAQLVGLKTQLKITRENWQTELDREIARVKQEKEEKMNVSLSEIQKQIRVCEAVQQTYDEAADGVDRLPIQKLDGDPTRSIERRELRKDTRDFRNVTIRPKTRVNHSDFACPPEDMSKLSQVMMDMLNIQAAPDADIDVFGGDPLDYHYFRASFRDAVESRMRDQRGLLTRLIKYTAGVPKELIKSFVYSDSCQCFDEAIELLEKEYVICLPEGATTMAADKVR